MSFFLFIHATLRDIYRNRKRSFHSGFGVFWGILILVILLSILNGFDIGVNRLFDSFAQKSLFVYGGITSDSFHGKESGRQITFDENITDIIRSRYPCIKQCSEMLVASEQCVSNLQRSIYIPIRGVSPAYFDINILKIKRGRLFNPIDVLTESNVAIIGEEIATSLFAREESIGKSIAINGTMYKVVGLLSSSDIFSIQERNSIYIPSASFRNNFALANRPQCICLSLNNGTNSQIIENDIRNYLAHKYCFNPNDQQALFVVNIESQTSLFEDFFKELKNILWIIGIGLLLSGLFGVSNVMHIIVLERTKEIGIRKALGATRSSIAILFVTESLFVTLLSGLAGIILSMLFVFIVNYSIIPLIDSPIISEMVIDYRTCFISFVMLIIGGVFAGLFPSVQASSIEPVRAIQFDTR